MAKSTEDVHKRGRGWRGRNPKATKEFRDGRRREKGRKREEEGRKERERDRGEEEIKRERAGERRKEEREGVVPLSVERMREATESFSITIISPSRARKRGTRKEAWERGKNSPLCTHACVAERRRVGEWEKNFSRSRAHARACKETRERGGGEISLSPLCAHPCTGKRRREGIEGREKKGKK